MNEDFGATTAVVVWARKRLTPGAIWGAITALAVAIGYVVNAQHDLHRHQESIAAMQTSIATLVKQSQDTRNDVTSIKTTVNDMKEADRERWERIEREAAVPLPHARRRTR